MQWPFSIFILLLLFKSSAELFAAEGTAMRIRRLSQPLLPGNPVLGIPYLEAVFNPAELEALALLPGQKVEAYLTYNSNSREGEWVEARVAGYDAHAILVHTDAGVERVASHRILIPFELARKIAHTDNGSEEYLLKGMQVALRENGVMRWRMLIGQRWEMLQLIVPVHKSIEQVPAAACFMTLKVALLARSQGTRVRASRPHSAPGEVRHATVVWGIPLLNQAVEQAASVPQNQHHRLNCRNSSASKIHQALPFCSAQLESL